MPVSQLPTFHHILAVAEIHVPDAMCLNPSSYYWNPPTTTVSRDEPRLCISFTVQTERVDELRCFTVQLRVYATPEVQVSTLVSRLNQARLQGDPQCDASLCVEGEWLPAHRLVLATQSPVFAKMFGGDFKEAGDGRVHLKDVSKGAAELLLEYMYTDRLEKCEGLELELLDLAERYCMNQLKQECRLLLWTVNAPRALQVLRGLPNPHVDADTKKRLVRIVVDNWKATTESSEWQEFQAENPLAAELLVAVSSSELTVSLMQPV
ncbi:speckle-type POZ protein-like isoform X2 [Thrips palmi]|uniref:Speckle-type POZ protein-like isoform X2 n=1 Tax=Thrips palmi TaxID=161013 RepID=A0A6P8YWQ9_THRPL|nr:speckle-type POZ protein-like isoform X2 [Thrips palmi]